MIRTFATLLGILGLIAVLAILALFRIRTPMPDVNSDFLSDVSAPSASAEKNEGGSPAKKSPARPDWVDAPPQTVGDAYQMSIAVGPYTTRAECDAQLPDALQEALNRYVEACFDGEVGERVVLPADYLRRQIVKGEWEEVRQYSVGPMTRLHVLLQFDRKVKDRVLEARRRTMVAGRLWMAGVGWAAWLALLGGGYGYLRFSAPRGMDR